MTALIEELLPICRTIRRLAAPDAGDPAAARSAQGARCGSGNAGSTGASGASGTWLLPEDPSKQSTERLRFTRRPGRARRCDAATNGAGRRSFVEVQKKPFRLGHQFFRFPDTRSAQCSGSAEVIEPEQCDNSLKAMPRRCWRQVI